MSGWSWVGAAVGGAAGLVAGVGIRVLLAAVPRGTMLRPGPAEAGTGAITAIGAGLTWSDPVIGVVVWLGLLTVALATVDVRHHRLPDALTLPAIPITAVVVAGTGLIHPGAVDLPRGALVAVVLGAVFAGLARVAPAAMGRGDVKLVLTLGLATGAVSWSAAVLAVLTAFVLGAAFALGGIALRRLRLSSAIAFGPFLLLGAWLVLVVPGLPTAVLG